MSDVAIRVQGVGKQYRLGGTKERYSTFGDQIRKWVSLRNLLTRRSRDEKRPPFWALKDVSFEVKRGEVVGIIGRNGAGKSTLLKILSRITEPTEGEIDIHGRVGSLLEVGTGFHPELTGRENIFLNGAILGMKRTEIARQFDAIVAFAEVEKFIDTPVKHYSSGMYTRLAFAVAAHLEPDILIVDEVLAVGDAQFQKKCLGKMGEVSKGGRTVLFVSHNMQAVASLCSQGVVLHTGQVTYSGNATDAIACYLNTQRDSQTIEWKGVAGDEDIRLLSTAIRGAKDGVFQTDDSLHILVSYELLRPVLGVVCAVEVYNNIQQRLIYSAVDDSEPPPATLFAQGRYDWELTLPSNILAAGIYRIEFDLGIHNVRRIIRDIGTLTVQLENVAGVGRRYLAHDNVIRPDWTWKLQSTDLAVDTQRNQTGLPNVE